ncbi:hypothetical protein ACFVY7_13940 [[Kitasatospora] papulosa]|uniref:hypothetical protein n=1 Tax=[Kitasatospora] papulosa TaxID=1464011 RepID=UPI0036BA80D7
MEGVNFQVSFLPHRARLPWSRRGACAYPSGQVPSRAGYVDLAGLYQRTAQPLQRVRPLGAGQRPHGQEQRAGLSADLEVVTRIRAAVGEQVRGQEQGVARVRVRGRTLGDIAGLRAELAIDRANLRFGPEAGGPAAPLGKAS